MLATVLFTVAGIAMARLPSWILPDTAACVIQSHFDPPARACQLICHMQHVLFFFQGVALKVLFFCLTLTKSEAQLCHLQKGAISKAVSGF